MFGILVALRAEEWIPAMTGPMQPPFVGKKLAHPAPGLARGLRPAPSSSSPHRNRFADVAAGAPIFLPVEKDSMPCGGRETGERKGRSVFYACLPARGVTLARLWWLSNGTSSPFRCRSSWCRVGLLRGSCGLPGRDAASFAGWRCLLQIHFSRRRPGPSREDVLVGIVTKYETLFPRRYAIL